MVQTRLVPRAATLTDRYILARSKASSPGRGASAARATHAHVAQMDRALVYETRGLQVQVLSWVRNRDVAQLG